MTLNISGYEIIIDFDDYDRIKDYNYFVVGASEKIGYVYFYRNVYLNKKHSTRLLHRDIMQCSTKDKTHIDHINGNTLDNRKCNLRVCTCAENARNSKKSKNNKSGIKGVSYHKASGKWIAQICVDRKYVYLGVYKDISKAKEAYCEASKKYHGEYGRTE